MGGEQCTPGGHGHRTRDTTTHWLPLKLGTRPGHCSTGSHTLTRSEVGSGLQVVENDRHGELVHPQEVTLHDF